MTYFFVPEDKYFAAYNDPDFIFHTKTQNNFDYLDVHAFYVGFKQHYPNYSIQYELTDEGNNLFYIKSTVSDKEFLTKQKQEAIEALNNVPDSKDAWKEKKKLNTRIQELNNEITYGYRGVVVKPYVIDLETGLRTTALDFPLMDNSMNSVINPDSRDVTDNLARAEVKCGARFCGYGYRLFTRHLIGKVLDEAPHVKVIKAIVGFSEELGVPVDKSIVNFGTSYNVLRQLAVELKEQVTKLAK
jgi:hypothetical protein